MTAETVFTAIGIACVLIAIVVLIVMSVYVICSVRYDVKIIKKAMEDKR